MLSLVLGCTHTSKETPDIALGSAPKSPLELQKKDEPTPSLEPNNERPTIPVVKEKTAPLTLQSKKKTSTVGVDVKKKPIKKTIVKKTKPKKKLIESLAILLSEGNVRDQQIADALKRQTGKPTELFYLSTSDSQKQVIERLEASSYQNVVAIGSTAANRAKELKRDKQVVFSQVFNYQADGLLDAGFSGVSMIPSTKVLIAHWKKLSPTLQSIAIITGPNNEQQISQITKVAEKQQVSIHHFVVNNDKEMLYTVEQVAEQVQGYWLLPDNRVLSRRGMIDFMSYTMQNDKQVAVFNRELLKIGGLLYVTVDPDYVAKQIIKAMESPSSIVLALDKAQIEVSPNIIQD